MHENRNEKTIIDETENFVKKLFENEGTGHDWWHIFRVRNLALKIADKEGGDHFLIEMAGLLHDVDDWKINNEQNPGKVEGWLELMNLDEKLISQILSIIDEVSFKGAGVETKASSQEAKIVQDADRLDAIGAIGIARAFTYGGSKSRSMYDPEISPEKHPDFEIYRKSKGPTINHFYEKLLLLKDRLNTSTAKKIAEKRHHFMEVYLEQFFTEWNNSS